MTNTIAVTLAATILLLLGADMYMYSGENSVFLARKLMELIEYVAFWR